MTVTPSGMLSLPLNYLKLTLAASSTFQAMVSAADAAAALAFIHPVQTDEQPPFAVLDWDPGWRRTAIAGGSRNVFQQDGTLTLLLRAMIDGEHDEEEAAYTFINDVGDIIADMEELAGTAGFLNITTISITDGPSRPTADEVTALGYDFYEIILSIAFE